MLNTAQKMKFSITDFFSKCDQIRRKLQIWSHLLKKSVMENFIFLHWNLPVFSKKLYFTKFQLDKYMQPPTGLGKSWNVLGFLDFFEKCWKKSGILQNVCLVNFHRVVVLRVSSHQISLYHQTRKHHCVICPFI